MGVPLVHYLHPETSTVQNVSPGVEHTVLAVHDGLVEVEAVQVEGHCAYAEGSKPNADDRPRCEEEVE